MAKQVDIESSGWQAAEESVTATWLDDQGPYITLQVGGGDEDAEPDIIESR